MNKKRLIFLDENCAIKSNFEYVKPNEIIEMKSKSKEDDRIILGYLADCYKQQFVDNFIYHIDILCEILNWVYEFQEKEVEELVIAELRNIYFEPIFENPKYLKTHQNLIKTIRHLEHRVF